ncbi:SDR family oxidoreductase [Paracoccus aminophilus]|uniref:Triphenylmethane reductase n=1 Tax=Paracoccus aminophilus JCM 7686 TaxID=1367847 RepID=S5XLI7_PARAH|nr:SDR family oxidoreductase [Paracoccus aminophilus]AGT08054.1 triphenylmethane reductase [Paracoccus aminophilus JCM 7686]
MSLAITGATGQLGRLVIADLKTRVPAGQIVALARSPAKAADLGVEARAFDYDSDVGTLAAALAGVDKLLLISGSEVGQRTAQHRKAIEAAKAAGVREIVYTSLLHADTSPLSLAREHVETEALLKASGIPHVILRNGWYGENYAGSIAAAVQHGALIGAAGAGRISAAARKDYATAASVVLSNQGHAGKTYELAADQAFTLADLAAEISAQTGKDVPYKHLSEGDYAAALAGAGIPADFAAMIAGWDVGASNGALYAEDKSLSTLIGRPTTPLREIVKAAL